jgi:hypothetical protein
MNTDPRRMVSNTCLKMLDLVESGKMSIEAFEEIVNTMSESSWLSDQPAFFEAVKKLAKK